eukprot:701518-Pyramimonas_sp.AAC.1
MCSYWLLAGGGPASRMHTCGLSRLDGALPRLSPLASVSLHETGLLRRTSFTQGAAVSLSSSLALAFFPLSRLLPRFAPSPLSCPRL